ncbi:hypothetical protein [Streptomyces sp. NBC_00826]|uniref:hypothetical protein n=1 Tax=Streptomyces sp. NBC_00826 TaxID=2975845 RepID=UPI003870CE1D
MGRPPRDRRQVFDGIWADSDRFAVAGQFVYAGIDVTATALFSGVRGAQLTTRLSWWNARRSRHASAHTTPSVN